MDDLGYEEGEQCGLKGCDGLLESERTSLGWSDDPCIGDDVSCPMCGRVATKVISNSPLPK